MAQPRISPICLAATLLVAVYTLGSPLTGRCQDPEFSKHVRIAPESAEAKPFSTVATRKEPLYTVEFRSADELSERDKLLLADAESSIGEHAGFADMGFQASGWSYRQIVCPTFPNHLFLQYTRSNGTSDTSMFSVSIPRNGEDRVRVIPILRRGYSLFSPAPINALTIAAFNHIRAEEPETANADWLGNALCYAALAGSQPEILPADAMPVPHKPVPALTAQMQVKRQTHGVEEIRFDDAAARPHAMEWTMTFSQKGKLIKAARKPATLVRANVAPEKSAVRRTWQVPQVRPN
jgi:hypothetical protein